MTANYRLLELAERLDQATMRQVFTHTSWAADRVASYERLEFLGDSVLALTITTELFRRFPAYAEGHLARLRAYIVSRATCARVATKLGLGRLLRDWADHAPEAADVAQLQSNQNVLADLTEALIGAVYLTFGYEAVRPAVIEAFEEHIQYAESSYVDHKTELQEHLARSGKGVHYRVLGFSGPPHNREFEIEAVVDGEPLGHGFGTSKKRAEQEAAAEVLHELHEAARKTQRRARLRGRSSRRPAADEADAERDGPGDAGGPADAERDGPGDAGETDESGGPHGEAPDGGPDSSAPHSEAPDGGPHSETPAEAG